MRCVSSGVGSELGVGMRAELAYERRSGVPTEHRHVQRFELEPYPASDCYSVLTTCVPPPTPPFNATRRANAP